MKNHARTSRPSLLLIGALCAPGFVAASASAQTSTTPASKAANKSMPPPGPAPQLDAASQSNTKTTATPAEGSATVNSAETSQADAELAQQARTAFAAGVAAFDSGEFASAADHFGAAYSLIPHPDVLLNQAQSELKAGRYAEAATHFYAYLHGPTPQPNAAANAGLAEAKRQIAELQVSAPRDAKVALDGTVVGVAPLSQPLFITPGAHQLSAGQVAETLTLLAGSTEHVNLVPGDLSHHPAQASEHVIGFVDWFLHSKPAWAGAGVAVAGLGFSAVAALTASNRFDSAENSKYQILARYNSEPSPKGSPCGPPALSAEYGRACNVYSDYRDAGGNWKTASIVSLLIGVASAGGTVAYYFADRTRGAANDGPPKVGFVIAPNLWALSVSGSL